MESSAQLQQKGRELADRWSIGGRTPLRTAARQLSADLSAIRLLLARSYGAGTNSFTDNLRKDWLLYEKQGLLLLSQLQSRTKLPELIAPEHTLRVSHFARSFLTQQHLTGAALSCYLEGVQQILPLEEQELEVLSVVFQASLFHLLRLQLESDQSSLADFSFSEMMSALGKIPFSLFVRQFSQLHQLYLADPVYPQMSEESQSLCRKQTIRLAARYHLSETAYGQKILSLSKQNKSNISVYLFRHPMGRKHKSAPLLVYQIPFALSIFCSLSVAIEANLLIGLLITCPLYSLLRRWAEFIILHLTKARPILRLSLSHGIPPEGRTLTVYTDLLTDSDVISHWKTILPRCAAANTKMGREGIYGILCDLPDRPHPMTQQDHNLLEEAVSAIRYLNETTPWQFVLLFRPPIYSEIDQTWQGWERKRGALLELAQYLSGKSSTIQCLTQNGHLLSAVHYLMVLDSDTVMTPNALPTLLSAMLHPMNRPVIDPNRRIVTQGFGLLQPRISPQLEEKGSSLFCRLMGCTGGLDPYPDSSRQSDYDLFQQGNYLGKGLIHIQSFLSCLEDRLPDHLILSHDLLEGSYLSAAYDPQVQLMDQVPQGAAGWLKRLHRWTRGDWQLLPFLLSRVPLRNGAWEKNPLPSVCRWKIVDRLLLSLSSSGSWLLLLTLSLTDAAQIWWLWLFPLLSITPIPTFLDLLFHRKRWVRHVFCRFSGPFSWLKLGLFQLGLLPLLGWCQLSAAATALYRMLITKRRLLDWTPSRTSELSGNNSLSNLPLLLSAFLLIFSRHWSCLIPAIYWTLLFFFLPLLSRPGRRAIILSQEEDLFIKEQAHLIWNYFQDWLRLDYHYLIPDHFQQYPQLGPALRTSPTNLGLSLLSCLSAIDLEFISQEEGLSLIRSQLETISRLEKWHGHLFNWYHISTLQPLTPRLISSVDSGNLCADLIALSQGLKELGEYALAETARSLALAMDFTRLYDSSCNLFYIAYDTDSEQFTPSHYDLMASEARMTSYLAAALQIVPPEHWRRLDRNTILSKGQAAMCSWGGTMFEYLMPQLLLPSYPGSFLYETLNICIRCQQEAEHTSSGLWGRSESGLLAFDHLGEYQYGTFGAPGIRMDTASHQPDMLSPYSAFLALSVRPHEAIQVLQSFHRQGYHGRYGLVEAVCPQQGLGLQSWMAHHLGMSLVSINNLLTNNIMIQRFLSDPSMGSALPLLQEVPPMSAPNSHHFSLCQSRTKENSTPIEGDGFSVDQTPWTILSNGDLHLCLSAGGKGGLRTSKTTLLHPDGIEIWYRSSHGRLCLFPVTDAAPALHWRFSSGQAALRWSLPELELTQTITLDQTRNGILLELTLSRAECDGDKLEIMLRPVLSPWDSYAAHPAFSRLGLRTHPIHQGVQFTRRPGRGDPQPCLTVLWDSPIMWTNDRENWMSTQSIPLKEPSDTVPDPCCLLLLPVNSSAKTQARLRIAIAAESQPNDSLTAAQSLLCSKVQPADLSTRLSTELKLDPAHPLSILSRLLCPKPSLKSPIPVSQQQLWTFGISGDLPMAAVAAEQLDIPIKQLLLSHQWLWKMGFLFDLILLLPPMEGQDLKEALLENAEGCPKDHLHLICGNAQDQLPIQILSHFYLHSHQLNLPKQTPGKSLPLLQPLPPEKSSLRWNWLSEGFQLKCMGQLPYIRWSHMITNSRLGWRCDECGTGHTWYHNAQMGQLTPWTNDPSAQLGPEDLLLCESGEETSFFARKAAVLTTVTFGPGYARWERKLPRQTISLTGWIPPEGCCRIWEITQQTPLSDAHLIWKFHPQMAHRHAHSRFCIPSIEKHGLSLYNPVGTMSDRVLHLNSDHPIQYWHLESDGTLIIILPSVSRLLLYLEVTELEKQPACIFSPIEDTVQWWKKRCCSITVCTPSTALNHYLSFWGPYQTLAGRIMGRSGLYQCGGAYGFRDQLQDVLLFLPTAPEIAREQLLRAAAHQFREGDVLHWWHPEISGKGSRGVRTRISDDLLWLSYGLSRWYETTGDLTLPCEKVPYLEGASLGDGVHQHYDLYTPGDLSESVYQHAIRATDCVIRRGFGSHGLCLIGTGDWNDGMDQLGEEGRGESVWLTWFLLLTLRRLIPLCKAMGDSKTADRYNALIPQLSACAQQAWDGGWYLRAYNDNGAPIGSQWNSSCRIDSIAQSFARLAIGKNTPSNQEALHAALKNLYDSNHQLIRLLTPPFSADSSPGYISSYPPGIRENGGQYTHAACWLVIALLESGEIDLGTQLLLDLLPENHPEAIYRGEPYVLAGDVWDHPDLAGRCGWSWYTGAAGWFCQGAYQSLLGLRFSNGQLLADPKLPAVWKGYEVQLQGGDWRLSIHVSAGLNDLITLDGKPHEGPIDLKSLKGSHRLTVVCKKE